MSQRPSALQAALAALACAAFTPSAEAQPAASAPAPSTRPAQPGAQSDSEEADTVVVTGIRPPGSVPGDAVPQIVLGPAEIQSYGASNLEELLASLAPETGSARGRGSAGPIILLNGRRVAGFNEIRTLPPEAILRVEIFTEEVALQYGYSADQRVVNIVLRRFFRAITSEGDTGAAAHSNAEHNQAELGDLNLTPRGRVNVDGKLTTQNAFNQIEARVTPSGVGPDDRAERTLAPDSESLDATGVWNHAFNRVFAGTSSLTVQSSNSESMIGVDPVTLDAIRSKSDSNSAHLGFTLDASTANWLVTATATAQRDESHNRVEGSSPSLSDSVSTAYEGAINTTGALFAVPAGQARLSARGSFSDSALDGKSVRNGLSTHTSLNRSALGARFTLNAPILSTRHHVGGIGELGGNLSYSISDPSDTETTSTFSAGVNWAPIQDIHLSLQANHAQAAPSLQQLGAPTLVTPGQQVFDPITGQTVIVTTTTGGNPALKAEEQRDFTLNASYSPHQIAGLTLSASYVRNETQNALTAFPLFTPALETAFPNRFTRDAGGNLIAIDRRPINLAERDSDTARVGITFSQGFGPRITGGGGLGGFGGFRGRGGGFDVAPAPNAAASSSSDASTPAQTPPPSSDAGPPPDASAPTGPPPGAGRGGGGFGGGRGGGGGGRRGGGGFGGGGAQAGRFNFSIFYTRRIEDAVVFQPGQQAIDLLQEAALGGDGGGGPDKVEFEGGVTWRGLGMRLNGTWNSGYQVLGTVASQDLTFSDVATVNLRAFLDFNSRPELVRAHPFLRSMRIVARVDNLTDSVPKVTDAAGVTPFAYQHNLLAPQGRVWEIGIRKLF